jgi:UDP-N-acetyl-D-mannosaminuronic acid dehydrogenase
VILIDVETPVNDEHIPEYQALRSALKSLSAVLKEGALVVIESTIMPGTMKNVVLPILEENTGRKCGQGFYLGNCPERVMPGKLLKNLKEMSRVLGGDSKETAAAMRALYSNIVQADLDEANWITAELVKTVENTYRDVQIAFANETALICEALGADAWRVRELVRKSPGREMLLPGAGVGGHCIPKDPWLLASSVKGLGVDVRLIPAARAINSGMPAHMLTLLQERLKKLEGKRILVLGYAYLENSDDTRDAPSQHFIKGLISAGAEYIVHDPFVKEHMGDLYEKALGCDAAVLMTAHSEYKDIDFKRLKEAMGHNLLVDGRNLWNKENAIDAGMDLIRLGA